MIFFYGNRRRIDMPRSDGTAADEPAHGQRKRQARGERRIGQILDAAEHLMAELGVQPLSMNAIARRAGISPGSLYQYFPSKEAVVEEVSRRLAAQLQHTMGLASRIRTEPGPLTPEGMLDRLIEHVMLLTRNHPAVPAVLTGTAQNESDPLLQAVVRGFPACVSAQTEHETVTRDLALRILCAGLGLAARQPDPARLLRAVRQAILSTL
ncbi:TetR/AcrR family transcriptional regulator [Streptomyces sp. CB02009]|uniref:TetR/AcrR family transcriptional regulator n=1 Tax=Streptomyces sp. CB02009 TaxID=1703938 RepID=UPI001160FF09|nr:TetR/AcrR family transcriptional regulator [Streptomyces sp. CB02009]